MRVLHIHKDFRPNEGGGGTARHIHGLATALAATGCDVEVASLRPEVVTTPYRSYHTPPSKLWSLVARADVVHVHGARSKYAALGAALAFRKSTPFLYTPHAFYEPHGRLNRSLKRTWDGTVEKFLIERGFKTILLTDAWFGWLRERGISAVRTIIIPNCVLESSLIKPNPLDGTHLPGDPAILTIGRLDKVKRVGDVIRALTRPELARAHFHIVGRGDQHTELKKVAVELGVDGRVTFHGFVDDAGVAGMVAQSDVFVLASEQEGLPTVLIEMLMANQPVVCTRIPGNLAIMDVAAQSTTYEVGDIPALASLLARGKEHVIGVQAFNRLRDTFTWERRADELLGLYRAALDAQVCSRAQGHPLS